VIQDATKKLRRPYTGSFLARVDGTLVDPAVVIEIPTTLYALQSVPRIWRLERHPQRDTLKRRRIEEMMSNFEKTLNNRMSKDNIGERKNQIIFTRFQHLAEVLESISGAGQGS
jgi:hypothetical protein